MELRHLRYFIAVAETESFRRAATDLGVSQSPLSRQIQQLEEELDVELFAPAGRGVKLTVAGRLLLDRARTLLASLEAAVEETREVARGRIGTVRIGFEGGSGFFGSLSTVLARLRKREPRIHVELVPMTSADQWEALRLGKIAVAYCSYENPAFESIVLRRDRMGVIVAEDHRLATRSRIRVQDLAAEKVLIDARASNPRLFDDIISAVRARGVVLDLQEVLDGEALLTFVASGLGVTFGQERVMRFLSLGGAVWKPVADLGIEQRDIVMWRAADEASPLLGPLIELVRATHGDPHTGKTK